MGLDIYKVVSQYQSLSEIAPSIPPARFMELVDWFLGDYVTEEPLVSLALEDITDVVDAMESLDEGIQSRPSPEEIRLFLGWLLHLPWDESSHIDLSISY